jgi:hypothetical protein|tara:strand:+ start:349 stop:546 length:198 start_codon:yes stop_codon:yes gene_type:complete
MKVRIDIEYNGEHTALFCRGTEVNELSKMIRGGRETGFFYVNPNGTVVLIGSDVINGAVITVGEE